MKKNTRTRGILPHLGKRLGRWALCLSLCCFSVYVSMAQSAPTVTLNCQGETLVKAIEELRKQTHYNFLFNSDELRGFNAVSVNLSNVSLAQALEKLLVDKGLTYTIDQNNVVIRKKQAPQVRESLKVMGKVTDEKGQPLPGVTIVIKGTSVGTATDLDGQYAMAVPGNGENTVLVYSFVGMEVKEVTYTGQSELNVTLQPATEEMEEVVVTGMFTRKANTFSGSVTTMKKEELQRVGNANILQSLKNIDPSFMQVENLSAGSNPNALPDYQMRGSSTIADVQGEYASSANQPLFILDGFETELTKILDLDMNQVESLTLLKDATAKAIYGSKAANGVVVIETIRPKSGRLKLTYTGSLNIEAPDLSSYDLCDSWDKLEVERRAGLFQDADGNAENQIALDKVYTSKLNEVLKGANTDWKAQPARVGVGHKHSLYLEGGDNAMLYGVDLSYNNIEGVMKGSNRNTFSGGVTLSYRIKDLIFRNKLTIDYNDSNESPYGTFDTYCRLNPYSRLYDENGNFIKQFSYMMSGGQTTSVFNPLYNTTLNTIDNNTYTNITDNFYIEWQIRNNLRFTGRFGFVRKTTTVDQFKPANHTDFATMVDVFRKGSYYKADGKHTNLNADAGLSYSLSFGRHMIFTNVQLNISDNVYSTTGMQAEGFASDHMNDISFAVQYAKDARPTGTEGISRSCGGILSANYSFDERYLLDVNYRFSGSSETGADNRWGHFWSVGGGWNVHNESFMESLEWMNRFKLRASVGYTGSQGFSSYDAIPTFIYYQSSSYAGAVGSYVKGLANSALRWQEKYDINAGVDLNLLRNRLTARFDYYIGTTKGMITNVTVPYTTGFSTYVANLGEVENKGWEAYLNYKVYDNKRDYINVYAGMANNKNTLKKISNSLRAWNDARDKDAMSDPNDAGNREKIITPSVKYYEGCSMSAIWAVRSLGIDPQNGKEIFLKKDGTVTYEYDVADQIVCGDAQPKFNGNVGFNGEIKCFGFSATANYRFGGEYYNQTLVDKVENALVQYNVDRRVLTGRWQKEGDMARFKAVTDRTLTQPTSRFVEKYNLFTLSSLSLYYDFRECNFVKNSFLERLKITAYTNDLFVISSVKTERGTSYPFARTFSFSVQATF